MNEEGEDNVQIARRKLGETGIPSGAPDRTKHSCSAKPKLRRVWLEAMQMQPVAMGIAPGLFRANVQPTSASRFPGHERAAIGAKATHQFFEIGKNLKKQNKREHDRDIGP